MDAASAVLEPYRAVVASAERMLEQARARDWDAVARTARSIGTMTAELESVRRNAPEMGRADDRQRVRMLARLVIIDAEVRQLREPWTRRLDELLGPAQQRSLFCGPGPAARGAIR